MFDTCANMFAADKETVFSVSKSRTLPATWLGLQRLPLGSDGALSHDLNVVVEDQRPRICSATILGKYVALMPQAASV